MPAFIKTEKDEKNWQRAKSIVRKGYPGIEEKSEKFWKLVNHIYFCISKKKSNPLAESIIINGLLYDSKDNYSIKSSANEKMEIKEISFPKSEIPKISKQNRIITTRVSDDYDKFFEGDAVIVPWGKKYYVTERIEISNIKEHPFYDELTKYQINYLKKFDKIAVLTLKLSEDEKLKIARKFISDVKNLAEEIGLNVFVVTDGASGILNDGCEAVKAARDAHIKWELEHGSNPNEDWQNDQSTLQ